MSGPTFHSSTENSPGAAPAGAPDYEVLIIGTGFGGIGAAIQLRRMGIHSFVMLDRADDLGGTWHLNTYPGLAVDIPSATYQYSFEQNPNWSHTFARGPEVKAYAAKTAEKYQLRPHMRFGWDVTHAVYDDRAKQWTVHVRGRQPIRAQFLVAAIGYLSRPKRPSIPGLESFAGRVIHTAAWDHQYDLRGRRAAVIGTGATSVQLLPEIAPLVEQLDVYQRTPIWVSPKRDRRISPSLQDLYRDLPFTQRWMRILESASLELMVWIGILHYRQLAIFGWLATMGCKLHIQLAVQDPELRRKLTPSYGMGCKRPTTSNTYYPVFNRPNVELVTDTITRIEPDGIVTSDGRKRCVDTLVLATGFHVWGRDGLLAIHGRDGRELYDVWEASGFRSYEGITVPGFPNLFYLPAPYSYTGLSYFFAIEGAMKHIARCLTALRRQSANSFEVRQSAADRFVARMKKKLGGSVFLHGDCTGANSYYFDPHGEPTLLRPTWVLQAQLQHSSFPLSDYIFERCGAGARAQRTEQSEVHSSCQRVARADAELE
jgi:cation diffusion facilitator CzcD-associated flavoprotein CzcO